MSSKRKKKDELAARQAQRGATEYVKERSGTKALLSLVVVGHVDAGKSTLMGHLLFRLGQVSAKQMHKYEQESKKLGKQSFMYAWVLDETGEER
jgi:elongation factor 1 alpha-like protein